MEMSPGISGLPTFARLKQPMTAVYGTPASSLDTSRQGFVGGQLRLSATPLQRSRQKIFLLEKVIIRKRKLCISN